MQQIQNKRQGEKIESSQMSSVAQNFAIVYKIVYMKQERMIFKKKCR